MQSFQGLLKDYNLTISPIVFMLTSSRSFRDEIAEHTCDDYNIQDHVTSKLSKAYIYRVYPLLYCVNFDFSKSELTDIYTSTEQTFLWYSLLCCKLALLTFGSVDTEDYFAFIFLCFMQ